MKSVLPFILASLVSVSVFAKDKTKTQQKNEETGNYCSLLYPGDGDAVGTTCQGCYAVLKFGYMADGCFSTKQKAIDASQNIKACAYAGRITSGDCKLLYGWEMDKRGHYCLENTFGVAYKRRLLDDKCYDHVDKALEALLNSELCKQKEE
jgi:hypothetical protein